MRLRSIVRWRTKKQRWRSTSLICRVSRPAICTLETSLPRNRSARIRASTLSVLIWASAMMRVLKGLANTMRSQGTSPL
jgi:hypothetical protein